MVNKVINWTFGGFFRTIGRTIAFIVIGALIGLIFYKNDISIPKLLGIETISAQEVNSWATNQVKINTCNGNGTCTDSSNANGNQTYSGSSLSYPLNFVQWRLKASNGLSKDNYYTLTFGYKPTPDAIAVKIQPNFKKAGDYEDEDASCSQKYNDGWYLWTCSFEPRENYSSDEYLYVRITFYQEYLTKFQTRMNGFKVMRGIGGTIVDQTNIINNTINEQTQAINDINENLTDTNVDDDANDMGDFLTDFDFEGDGNLSTLVNLPLDFLESILFDDSFENFCVTYKSKNICLPSGSIVWRANPSCPSGMSCLIDPVYGFSGLALKTLLNVFACGYLSYKLLRSIIKTTSDLLDPDAKHNVEMMKL